MGMLRREILREPLVIVVHETPWPTTSKQEIPNMANDGEFVQASQEQQDAAQALALRIEDVLVGQEMGVVYMALGMLATMVAEVLLAERERLRGEAN